MEVESATDFTFCFFTQLAHILMLTRAFSNGGNWNASIREVIVNTFLLHFSIKDLFISRIMGMRENFDDSMIRDKLEIT